MHKDTIMNTNTVELNLDEMESVTGGKNEKGWEYIPKNVPAGCEVIKIPGGATLHSIAMSRGTTTDHLLKLNPKITNPNLIVAGFYLIVPII